MHYPPPGLLNINEYFNAVAEEVRCWLRSHLPEWASFQVRDHARYLGALMGPGAKDNIWSAALAK